MGLPDVQDTSTVPNLGELAVPFLVFHVLAVEELTDLVRVLSVTCAVEDACLPQRRSFAGGNDP